MDMQLCRLVSMIQAQDSHKMSSGSESPMFPTDAAAETQINPGVG